MEDPKKYTILTIDDIPQNLKLIATNIKEYGYEVIAASNGRFGIYAAQTQRPNLILLDVQMPEMDGYEVCKKLKENEITKDIPIVFLTAKNDSDDIVKGFKLGAVDYITKPFSKEELFSRIRIHLTIQKLENDLIEKNKELEQFLHHEKEINKIKTNLINLASHDLKTPLTVIRSSAEVLLRYNLAEEKKVRHYHNIFDSSNRIQTILNDVLVYSKSISHTLAIHLQDIDLKNFCENLVEEFELICRPTHKINFLYIGSLNFKIDTVLLYHILINLLSNAYKYSPKSDRIDFTVTNEKEQTKFIISDYGIGISMDSITKIFNDFYRADNTQGINGTGVGLSIVKQFAEQLGGKISVESKLNEGSKFTVVFNSL